MNLEIPKLERQIMIDIKDEQFDYAGTFKMKPIVDWNKLQYNTTYNSPDYFRSKFPPGFEYLPGFDVIIQNMAKNSKSPYEEMMEIILSSGIKY